LLTSYLNLNAYFDYRLIGTMRSGSADYVIPQSLAQFDVDRRTKIPIPPEVLGIYSRFRPTRLFRACRLEAALNVDCEIYVKDESATPTGNHKANSAYFIAELCRREGIRTLTTETTGNWGIALAMAAAEAGLCSISFLDSTSNARRPGTADAIRAHGGRVVIVQPDERHHDLLTLSADAAIQATKCLDGAAYVFGSVYGYFVVPQSIMGLEARQQLSLLGKYPDVVVGSCGGGANLLGIAAPFIEDILTTGHGPRIISAESENCPILSRGQFGVHGIDSFGHYPCIETYGLAGLYDTEYIGGLGSTVVAAAAAHFHRRGIIEPRSFNSRQALAAAKLFERTEGLRVALETAYQLAAITEHPRSIARKTVLVNVSSGRNDFEFYRTGSVG
jgi:tryptophan synthase beta chain